MEAAQTCEEINKPQLDRPLWENRGTRASVGCRRSNLDSNEGKVTGWETRRNG